jgi:hypothetical protein
MTFPFRDTFEAPDIVLIPEYTAKSPGVESVMNPTGVWSIVCV